MIFWILAAVLTALVVAALLRPLLSPTVEAIDRRSADLHVYKDQLAEVDRDLARGLMSEAEAEAARTEIARRLLAADRSGGEAAAGSATVSGPRRPGRVTTALAAVVGLAVPIAALVFYLDAGSPGLPSQPFAQRDPAEREAQVEAVAQARSLARELETSRADDPQGWVELGRRWASLGRWGSAAEAYGRAVGLTEGDPGVTSAYAEALVNADSGTVTEQARAAFERVVAERPGDPRARFYLGLADAQAGNDEAALERWTALLADSPPDAPWIPVLRSRIGTTAERLGRDVAEIMPEPGSAGPAPALPEPPPAASADAPAGRADAPPGPTAEQMEQAAEMDPEDRQAMIRSMVESLAVRLEANPEDVEGWMRLGRSRLVLGEEEAALEAYRRAAEQAPQDAEVLRSLADALLATAEEPGNPGAEFEAVMERLYAADPEDMRALWYQGLAARRDGDEETAAEHWRALLAQLPPDTEEHALVKEQLDALEAGEAPPVPEIPDQPSGG
ncbi:MAG: c-type cytochrome biogenesis protein CcmI [Azospirillaceae bacterium]